MKKHPAAIAMELYKLDHEDSYKTSTLGNNHPDYYLKNRLEMAFLEGWNASEKHFKKIKKLNHKLTTK